MPLPLFTPPLVRKKEVRRARFPEERDECSAVEGFHALEAAAKYRDWYDSNQTEDVLTAPIPFISALGSAWRDRTE